MTKLGDLERKRDLTRPAGELLENVHFIAWAQGVREELVALKELPWALGPRPAREHEKILESCGLAFPKDSKELLECFLAVKAVVHYTEKRLRKLEDQARRYQELTKKMERIMEEERGK